ncbi:MAG: tRNA 2-selenouridine(34) synthase MnmH [Alphaproteobacteria bacterium]|nr:MAG: tRNA 2-selenouridine(34) synthase MnmH [Alphaproteobacteria bacterium]
MRSDVSDFLPLFLNDIPLLDVRAPVEFAKGSFPGTVNLPLLNDEERHAVGTMYKAEGQDAAVRLGRQLVSGNVKSQRVAQWLDFAKRHPEGCLFCFRGGMRSHIVQQWMVEAGTPYPLVKGGYKALRRFLIEALDNLAATKNFIVIGGQTGIGKTLVIREMKNSVDIEQLANHRGSTFGRRLTPQPGQIDFENALAVRLLKLFHASDKPIFIEDEGRLVGRCAMPPSLLAGLNRWPVVILEEPLESRISNVQKDYITDLLAEYQAAYGEGGFPKFAAFLKDRLHHIRKRLGGLQYEKIASLMDSALAVQKETQDESLHRVWIEELLLRYYDPMYEYQLSHKEGRVVFRGNRAEVLDWCRRQ